MSDNKDVKPTWLICAVNNPATCATFVQNYWANVNTTANNSVWVNGAFISFPTMAPSLPDPIELDYPLESKAEPISAGHFCKKCNEFFEFAEANQDDKSFICYSCRLTW